MFGKICDVADDDDLSRLLAAVGKTYRKVLQTKISDYTKEINRIGSKRVEIVGFLMQLIADPHSNFSVPFNSEEAKKRLDLWLRMIRNSRIRGARKLKLQHRLIELMAERMDLNAPCIPIASPLDLIICLHFSRIDGILELTDYFTMTERWLSLINRRAILTVSADMHARNCFTYLHSK